MCGIVGYIGKRACSSLILDGLKRLEYRGYDSAGIAVYDGKDIQSVRAAGKLEKLAEALQKVSLDGSLGIGHTRWATHGKPTDENAHPHIVGDVAIVHNGIVENHLELHAELAAQGVKFQSETDTEIIAHLIERSLKKATSLEAAVSDTLKQVRGTYALAVMSKKTPDRIVIAKLASPLVIGVAEDEMWAGSDIPALLSHTRKMIFLEDGDIAVLTQNSFKVQSLDGKPVERPIRNIDWSPAMAEKSGYKHFMLKEVHEQPRAFEDTLRGRLLRDQSHIDIREVGLSATFIPKIERIYLLACGTSHHSALVARYWFETLCQIPTVVELASEYRGRSPIIRATDLVIAVTQSGETSDTLAAAKEAKNGGATVLAVTNVIGSAISRLADCAFYTHAGPEIGVASTKCFTTQLGVLLMLGIFLGRTRNVLSHKRANELIEGLARLPQKMTETIEKSEPIVKRLAKKHRDRRDVLFLGRSVSYPIALEGALKLKEISYIHAEGYAAGEMKHGPIALIDADIPVFVIAPKDLAYERTVSNLQEVRSRDAEVIAIATEGDEHISKLTEDVVYVPETLPELSPFLTILPLQLYAYYVADAKGTDVDQPRNLAKTVTVE